MEAAGRVPGVVVDPFLSERLEQVFDTCFAKSFHTGLLGGADEPLYRPRSPGDALNALYYRQDYFASALHEVAHWCIAGEQRRQQLDFGYWYAPEGRSVKQQLAFEAVERKPQALEWYFSKACGYRFRLSADNLALTNTGAHDTGLFQRAVLEQALQWQRAGLPARAAEFYRALSREFATGMTPEQLHFSLEELQ